MSLEHEFFLVPNTVAYPELMKRNEKNVDIIDSIDIPDDLIQYIVDSLNWIPCQLVQQGEIFTGKIRKWRYASNGKGNPSLSLSSPNKKTW